MSACKNRGPVSGMSSTIEMMVAPEIMCGSVQPMVLTMGLMAMRTGYLNSSLLSLSPFDRAVVT